jgi:4-amino-4-deoxy-L-arabinose transferase-like glycosyltransferase
MTGKSLLSMRSPGSMRAPGAWLDWLCAGLRPYAVTTLLLVACALPGLVSLQPLDRDESRFAQATAQMFESGDFIRISFQDEPRNKKPVGIHWMQAVPVALTGGPEARVIQVYRLPSLLGALLAALATVWIGARMLGPRAGLVAGAALGASLLLSTEAGIAKTDAMLTGLIVLAFAGLVQLRHPAGLTRPGAGVFWIALALAVLVKGPVAVMVIGPALLLLAVWERDLIWMKPLADWRWIGAAALVAVPWHVAIWIATDGQFFVDAIGQDLAPKVAGVHENDPVPPGAHLVLSMINLWPGGLLAGFAVWAGWTMRRSREGRFLVAWLVPGWLIFEAAPAKLLHYTLPVIPALVLLGAAGLVRGGWANLWARGGGLVWAALGTLAVAALPVLVAQELDPQARGGAQVLSALIAVAGGAGLIVAAFGRAVPAAVLLALAALTASVTIKGVFLPSVSALDVSRRTSDALVLAGLHPRLSPGQPGPLVGVGYQEPSLIFLTRSDSALASLPAALAAARPGSGVVAGRDQAIALEQALLARDLLVRWQPGTIRGLNYSKGDPVELLIGRLETVPR